MIKKFIEKILEKSFSIRVYNSEFYEADLYCLCLFKYIVIDENLCKSIIQTRYEKIINPQFVDKRSDFILNSYRSSYYYVKNKSNKN